MTELLDKSSSSLRSANMMNNSKLKFQNDASTTSKTHQSQNLLNNSKTLNTTKSSSIVNTKQQHNSNTNKSLSNTLNHSSYTKPPIKKPIIEYNGVGDNPIESEKTTLYSTWTPLSDESTNNKVMKLNKQNLNFNLTFFLSLIIVSVVI